LPTCRISPACGTVRNGGRSSRLSRFLAAGLTLHHLLQPFGDLSYLLGTQDENYTVTNTTLTPVTALSHLPATVVVDAPPGVHDHSRVLRNLPAVLTTPILTGHI
jgi:hypothetical protein